MASSRPASGRAACLCLLAVLLAPASGRDPGFDPVRLRSDDDLRPLSEPPPPRHRASGSGFAPLRLDSVIRTDFLCNDDSTGGCRQTGPAVAVRPDGGFVVSWTDFRDGNTDVWLQRFDPSGVPLGANTRVNIDTSMHWQAGAALDAGPDGGSVLTWEDRRVIGNSDLFGQRLDAAGQPVGRNFRVSDSAAPGDQAASGVRFGPDGGFLAAWDDRRFGITGDIFARFYAPDGSPRDTNVRVNDDPVGMANQYEPSVGADDSGRFVVVWMDGRGLNPYDWNIFAQRFGPDMGRLGPNLQVTTDDSTQWHPALGVRPDGGFTACWEDERNGNVDVYARCYDASALPRSADFRVNGDAGDAAQYAAAAAANRFGEALILWADERSGDACIYGRLVDSAGSPAGADFAVVAGGAGSSCTEPAAAADTDGGWWVVWLESRDENPDVFCRRLDRGGNPLGPEFRVNDDGASSQQRISSIGIDARGVSCVAWEDERHGRTDIFCCLFDSTGAVPGSNRRLNDDGPGGAAQYYAAVAAGNGRYVVAWVDGRSGIDIYAQFLDGAGDPVGANQRVNSGGSGTTEWYPFCAMDSGNRAVVAWMDYRSEDCQVYARRYDASGNPVGPDFLVGEGTGADQVYPSAGAGRHGGFVVAWMDYRNGDADIYCQPFRADGTPAGANIRVNTDTAGPYQGYPGCAMAGDGTFAIVWEETRNERYQVYIQWFDSVANRLGAEEPVNDGPVDAAAYSPTCSFDPDGDLAVVFNDERGPEQRIQVYCQRFRADRSRISGNQVINEPGVFPDNHQWLVGQSVAATRERVAFAWTDNRRHRGFDIYAKLTDWDLVGCAEDPVAAPRPVARLLPTVSAGRFRLPPGAPDGPLAVRDAAGRTVLAVARAGTARDVDLSRLGPGVYFVTGASGDGRLAQKVIIR